MKEMIAFNCQCHILKRRMIEVDEEAEEEAQRKNDPSAISSRTCSSLPDVCSRSIPFHSFNHFVACLLA